MTRIADLQKKYPTVPKELIVKWDVQNSGVRDTEALYAIMEGLWGRKSRLGYQSHDHGVTMKETAEKWSDRLERGSNPELHYFYMKNGMGCRPERDPHSSYEFRDLGDGKLALFDGEEQVDLDLYFIKPYSMWEKGEPVTSKGNPISAAMHTPMNFYFPHCFAMFPLSFCEYFTSGEQCKFCNLNPSQDDARSLGIDVPVAIGIDETFEAYKILSSEYRQLEGSLSGGGLSGGKQGNMYIRVIEGLNNPA